MIIVSHKDMSTKKENLNLIASYFLRKWVGTTDIGLFEFGIEGCRFDCILFNGHRQRIRGFEFKVSRADFLHEIRTGKWKQYLRYCHTFSFVCPKGLIDRSEIPKNVGLLWITTVNEHYGYTNRNQGFPYPLWKKRPKFLGEISETEFRKIVLILIGRIKYRKDDFF